MALVEAPVQKETRSEPLTQWVHEGSCDALVLLALDSGESADRETSSSKRIRLTMCRHRRAPEKKRRSSLPAAVLAQHVAPFLRFDEPLPGMLYSLGGRNRKQGPVDTVEMLDTWHGRWLACPPMPRCRAGTAAASLPNGHLLVVGGYDARGIAEGVLRECDIYDPWTETWRCASPLQRGRWGHGCAALGNRIYVVGGCSPRLNAPAAAMETLRSCEVYDPSTDSWTEVAPLQVARSGARLIPLPGGRLAVVGGCTDVFGRAVSQSSVEIFDEALGTWTLQSLPLSEPRSSAAAAAVGDSIFVAGGAPTRNTAEVYPLSDSCSSSSSSSSSVSSRMSWWMSKKPESKKLDMGDGRMGCQAAVMELPAPGASFPSTPLTSHRCVVIVGGEQAQRVPEAETRPRTRQLSSVAVFDLDAGAWRRDGIVPPLSVARTTAALCMGVGRVAVARATK